jgi:hypothetical protein
MQSQYRGPPSLPSPTPPPFASCHWVEIAESWCQVLHLIRFPKVVWPVEEAWKPDLYTLPINTRTNTMSRTVGGFTNQERT